MHCRLWGESQDLFDFFEGKALVEELGGLGLVVVGEKVEDFGWIVRREASQRWVEKILRLFPNGKTKASEFFR